MKKLFMTMVGIAFMATPAFATTTPGLNINEDNEYTWVYNWATNYGHWNSLSFDQSTNWYGYGADQVIIQSSGSPTAVGFWQGYYDVVNGQLVHSGNGFSVNGGHAWMNNAGSGTRDTTTLLNYYQDAIDAGHMTEDNIYSSIRVAGLEDAHNDGWTGKGVEVIIKDAFPGHGDGVTKIARLVAPGATYTSMDWGWNNNAYPDVDVMNFSYGVASPAYNNNPITETITYRDNYIKFGNGEWIKTDTSSETNYAQQESIWMKQYWTNSVNNNYHNGPNAVHVYSAGNDGTLGTNLGERTTTNYENQGKDNRPELDTISTNPAGVSFAHDTYESQYVRTGDGLINTTICKKYGNRFSTDTCTGMRYIYQGDNAANVDKSKLIIVGALDHVGTGLAGYSQSAGELAKHDFMVARTGVGYGSGYGTSYTAPRVSGAAALIIQKFETDAVATKKILFATADDLGEPGVDPVYGHGLLNVGAAMSPIGLLQ